MDNDSALLVSAEVSFIIKGTLGCGAWGWCNGTTVALSLGMLKGTSMGHKDEPSNGFNDKRSNGVPLSTTEGLAFDLRDGLTLRWLQPW